MTSCTSENKRKRATKVTAVQQSLYLELLKSNVAFRTQKIDPTNPDAIEEAWDQLVGQLNSCGSGPQKSKDQWKKTFVDWKSTCRKKACTLLVHASGTGGGPAEKTLGRLETELVDVLGRVAVTGAPGLCEGGLPPAPLLEVEEGAPVVTIEDIPLMVIIDEPPQPSSSQAVLTPNLATSTTPSHRSRGNPRTEPAYSKAVSEYAKTTGALQQMYKDLGGSFEKLATALDKYSAVKDEELDLRRKELQFNILKFKIANPDVVIDIDVSNKKT